MHLSRRSLLAGTAAAAAVGAAAGGAAVYRQWWDQPAAQGFRELSEEEAAFIRAFAGAVFPPGEVVALDGGAAGLDHFLDDVLHHGPAEVGRLLRLLLHALDSAPRLRLDAAFVAQDLAQRQATVHGWLYSPLAEIRSATQALVVLIGMGYTTTAPLSALLSPMHGCGYSR